MMWGRWCVYDYLVGMRKLRGDHSSFQILKVDVLERISYFLDHPQGSNCPVVVFGWEKDAVDKNQENALKEHIREYTIATAL